MEHFKRILFLPGNCSTPYFWNYNFLWDIDRCYKFWWFAIGHSVSDGYKSSSRKQYLRYYPLTCSLAADAAAAGAGGVRGAPRTSFARCRWDSHSWLIFPSLKFLQGASAGHQLCFVELNFCISVSNGGGPTNYINNWMLWHILHVQNVPERDQVGHAGRKIRRR